jgi:hypothetical protein
MTSYHPIPSPLIGGVREREPEYRHLKRVAIYDNMRVGFTHDEDGDNYDVTGYTDADGNLWPKGEELLLSLMKAHKITLKELIEQAPKVQDA